MHIPFRDLAKSLGTTLAPLGIGMLIAHFIPKVRLPVKRIVKPVFITLLFLFLWLWDLCEFLSFYVYRLENGTN